MQVLVKVYSSSEYPQVSAAVVEFEPADVLKIMDNWPDSKPAEMTFYDYASWYDVDSDVADVLDNDPIVEFSEIPLGNEESVDCERMVVDENRVYWTGSMKYTGEHLETSSLGREFISKFKTAVQRLGEAIEEAGNG